MDVCVRCLRDGGGAAATASPSPASVVLLVDDTGEAGCLGGDAVFDRLLTDVSTAIQEGRSQAQQLHAVAVDRPPSELRALGASSVTDLFGDPCGWRQPGGGSSDVRWTDLQALQRLCQNGLAGVLGAGSSCCLVLAGLSTLLQRHSSMQVLQVLHQLRACPQVSSMLLSVHQDLHPPQLMAALQTLSTAVLQLQPVRGLQQQLIAQATSKPCHGALSSSMKRSKQGRLKVDEQLFTLLPAGGVEVYAAPQGVVLDAQALVATSLSQHQQQQQVPSAGGAELRSPAGEVVLANKLASSMRLDTTEQERAAKAAVQLPYAHQGVGRAYDTGDARQYLPPAAGGFGPGVAEGGGGAPTGGSRLGHILYVRDSDEEHDSDEDPDDDLDV